MKKSAFVLLAVLSTVYLQSCGGKAVNSDLIGTWFVVGAVRGEELEPIAGDNLMTIQKSDLSFEGDWWWNNVSFLGENLENGMYLVNDPKHTWGNYRWIANNGIIGYEDTESDDSLDTVVFFQYQYDTSEKILYLRPRVHYNETQEPGYVPLTIILSKNKGDTFSPEQSAVQPSPADDETEKVEGTYESGYTVLPYDGSLVYFDADKLNVRDAPDNGKVIAQLSRGDSVHAIGVTQELVTIDGHEDRWVKIDQVNDKELSGWVFGGFLGVERGGPKYFGIDPDDEYL
jgi:hypothetical protein